MFQLFKKQGRANLSAGPLVGVPSMFDSLEVQVLFTT